jgi:hypothetical protein
MSARWKISIILTATALALFGALFFILTEIRNDAVFAIALPIAVGASAFIIGLQKCPSCNSPVMPRLFGIWPHGFVPPRRCPVCGNDLSEKYSRS